MLMGKEAFKDHKVVHLEDKGNKVRCPVLTHSGYRARAKDPTEVGFSVAQLERLPTVHEVLGSSLSTTHSVVQWHMPEILTLGGEM